MNEIYPVKHKQSGEKFDIVKLENQEQYALTPRNQPYLRCNYADNIIQGKTKKEIMQLNYLEEDQI